MLAKEKALKYIKSRADETGMVEISRDEAKEKAGIKGIGWRLWEFTQEGRLKKVGRNRYMLVEREKTDAIAAVVTLSPEEVKKHLSGELTRLGRKLQESQGEEAVKVFDKLVKVTELLSGNRVVKVSVPVEWDVLKEHVIAHGLALNTWEPGRGPASAKGTAGAAERKAS